MLKILFECKLRHFSAPSFFITIQRVDLTHHFGTSIVKYFVHVIPITSPIPSLTTFFLSHCKFVKRIGNYFGFYVYLVSILEFFFSFSITHLITDIPLCIAPQFSQTHFKFLTHEKVFYC